MAGEYNWDATFTATTIAATAIANAASAQTAEIDNDLKNDSGASVTATVRFRQAVVA